MSWDLEPFVDSGLTGPGVAYFSQAGGLQATVKAGVLDAEAGSLWFLFSSGLQVNKLSKSNGGIVSF